MPENITVSITCKGVNTPCSKTSECYQGIHFHCADIFYKNGTFQNEPKCWPYTICNYPVSVSPGTYICYGDPPLKCTNNSDCAKYPLEPICGTYELDEDQK